MATAIIIITAGATTVGAGAIMDGIMVAGVNPAAYVAIRSGIAGAFAGSLYTH